MDSLIFAINAVAPIIILVAIGYILKRIGLMNGSFSKTANKLVFHVFLPSMLFLNVYNIDNIGGLDFSYIIYVLVILILIFVISAFVVILVTIPERRGALLQGIFRSNFALIGLPLANSLFGDEGVMVATLLSAVTIPILNVLAVISLSVYNINNKIDVKKIILNIINNPLIRSIMLGIFVLAIRAAFIKCGIDFRLIDIAPLHTALKYLSNLATPLALLVLGAQFEFSVVSSLKREIIFGTLMRTVIVPTIGIGVAYLLFAPNFSGAHFAAFVAFFATPVAVSSVPMAQEMNNDAVLAGQLVVWSTLISAFSVFVFSFLLRLAGMFA